MQTYAILLIFGTSLMSWGFHLPPVLKFPITFADRIFTKMVDIVPPPVLEYMNLVPVNSTTNFQDKMRYLNAQMRYRLAEAVAVREVGKAMVAAYYNNAFHVENVTMDKDDLYAHANYWSISTGKTRDEIDKELHQKITVVFGSLAAEMLYYDDDSAKPALCLSGHPSKSHFEEAYSILYIQRNKFRVLVHMLLEHGFVDGGIIREYLKEDVCDIDNDCSF